MIGLNGNFSLAEIQWVYHNKLVRWVKLQQLESEMDHQNFSGKEYEFNTALKLHEALCNIDCSPPPFPDGINWPMYYDEERLAHTTWVSLSLLTMIHLEVMIRMNWRTSCLSLKIVGTASMTNNLTQSVLTPRRVFLVQHIWIWTMCHPMTSIYQ